MTAGSPRDVQLRKWILDYLSSSTEFNAAVKEYIESVLTTRGDLLTRDASEIVRLAKGTENHLLQAGANDPAWVGVSAVLDSLLGTTRGSVVYRGASAWAALAPGTAGHRLQTNGAGADPTWAALPAAPAWTLIESRTVDGNESFTGLASYREIMVDVDEVTASSSGIRAIRVSTDNGSSFLSSSGDYRTLNGDGTQSNDTEMAVHQTSSSSARNGVLIIHNFNVTSPKIAVAPGIVTTAGLFRIPVASALNAIQLMNTAGNPNGGTCRVWGKPA